MCCGREVPRAGLPISGEQTGRFSPQFRPGVRFERITGANALVDRYSALGGFQRSIKRYYPRGGAELASVRGSEQHPMKRP